MKKIYALFAAALVAGTAFAAHPGLRSGNVSVKAAPFASEKVAAVHDQLAKGEIGQTMTLAPAKAQNNSGTTWTVKINVNASRWCDLLQYSDGTKPTFEELPMYWVTFYTYDDATSVSRVYFDYCMPAKAVFEHYDDDEYWTSEGDFNWDLATETYGSLEAAEEMVDATEFTEYSSENNLAAYLFPYGYIPSFCGLFNMNLFSSNPHYCTYKGTSSLYLRPGTYNSSTSSITTTNAAYISWQAYDEETNEIEATFYAPLGTVVTSSGTPSFGTLKGTLSETIEGDAAVFGFSQKPLEIGEVHLFNLGEANEDLYIGSYESAEYTLGDLYEDYEPANMYYVAFCSPTLTYNIEETTLPKTPSATSETTSDTYYYYSQHLTLAPTSDPENTYPEGLAKEEWWTYDSAGFMTNTLKPNVSFPAYYATSCADSAIAASLLGGVGALYGWTMVAYYGSDSTPYPTYGFGDANYGFNASFQTNLGQLVWFTYKGDIQYHYDADDYRVAKTISAVGSADANAISDYVGVKTVATASDAEVVATQYYNFQGIRLNGAPEKGIYIVRNLKADGTVETLKVAK